MAVKFEEILQKIEAISPLKPPCRAGASDSELQTPGEDLDQTDQERPADIPVSATRRDEVPLITTLPVPAVSTESDPFTANVVLFGIDQTPGIVAVEFTPPNRIDLYIRDASGGTSRYVEPFQPFLWEQNGSGSSLTPHYYHAWWRFREARYDSPGRERYFLNDPVQQYLTQTGRTLFKGMRFEDLRRMQIDIETSTSLGYSFSNPERDRLLAIAMSDSTGWSEILVVTSPESERDALVRMCDLVTDRDPDVIEGHNIFKFDLWYLFRRAQILGIELPLGRAGVPLTELPWAGRLSLGGGHYIEFPNYQIHGRHILDTYLLAELYDQGTRTLENTQLKHVAQMFGVAEKDRVLLVGAEAIMQAYHNDREAFCCYALADVYKTGRISAILSRSYFVQSQIFPFNYQSVILRGNATKVDALFLREYLRQGEPIPLPPPRRDYSGGLCEVLVTGVVDNVWHCDITSLYPSTILAFDCVPKSDVLGVFKRMVADLREYRIKAKKATKVETDPLERRGSTPSKERSRFLSIACMAIWHFPLATSLISMRLSASLLRAARF